MINQTIKRMNVNQDKITYYLTLTNKANLEIERTGWVSEETDDALEAVERTLTPEEINAIIGEMESTMDIQY